MTGGPSAQEQQAQTNSWNNLNSIFGTATAQANKSGAAGSSVLDNVTKYFQSLLSGNKTDTAKAVAPAADAATAQADTQKKQAAEFGTSRSGGTNAQNRTIDDQTRAQIDSLVGQTAPGAANSLTQIGESEIGNMLSALGLGTSATGTVGSQVTSDINTQRQAAAQMWSSLISGGIGLGGAAIGNGGELFGGGGGGTESLSF